MLVWTLPLIAVPAIVQPESPAAKAAVRDVTLTVRLTKDGQPLTDFPLWMHGGGKRAEGITDAEGRVALRAPVAEDRKELYVGFNRSGKYDPKWRLEKLQQYRSLTFARRYYVPIAPTDTTASFELNVTEAVHATIKLEGDEVRHSIVVPEMDLDAVSDEAGNGWPGWKGRVRTIGCLPRNQPTNAFIVYGDGYVLRVPIPAMSASRDLGSVQLGTTVHDCKVMVTIVNQFKDSDRMTRTGGVTFVSTDGKTIRTFTNSDRGKAVVPFGDGKIMLPEGSYYVVAGMFLGEPEHTRLIERAIAGEDLTKIGVKSVRVKKGEVAEVTIDDTATVKAVLADVDGIKTK